ncbi:DUF4446 family protein [Paenibacillus sp. MZ04-78.2]|uniref:DUF4446 family protein n=1 Tax=Paenibacillus sp. MZ04-78.2 TaxID=2962034 RepID=UPI0020B7EF4C|nr:DUF4446 family protein [Paenibacillus sp. MZ04-78.2]MCP3775180.1 DUF4446 family protein [Paenibacillus sp. MZ04-78.2]
MGDAVLEMPVEVLLFITAAISLLFLIFVIVLWVKLNKLRRNYKSMLNGTGSLNIEQILLELQEKGSILLENDSRNEQQIQAIRRDMSTMKSQIGVYRYNAFAETGSDLSFSIAILDEQQTGVVFSGIHGRDETYVYAKPVEQGQSQYALSPEEKEAISRSVPKR